MDNIKVMPRSMEAEAVVLGAVISDKDKIDQVEDILRPEDFYHEGHKKIYKGILNLRKRDKEINLVALCEELKSSNSLEAVGGITYLSNLAGGAVYYHTLKSYSDIILEKASRRRIIKACGNAIDKTYGQPQVEEIIESLEENLLKVNSSRDMEDIEHIGAILMNTIAFIEERMKDKKEIIGISTGFRDLDMVTSGLQRGDLIVIAGRPSMGKTAFALNIAQYASREGSVGIFSLEMPTLQLSQRLLAAKCLIPFHKIKRGALNDEEIDKLMNGSADLSKRNLYVEDTATTMSDIKAKAKALKQTSGLDVIVIDYLQLIEGSGPSASREQEISKISRELKRLAKQLNITVIALSQLSRAPELRADSRPMLSDLRESGAIEQDADIVIFPYRESYYDKEADAKQVEIIIGKNRNGEVTTVNLGWSGEYQRFLNLTI